MEFPGIHIYPVEKFHEIPRNFKISIEFGADAKFEVISWNPHP